jgi:hypothetical protein
MSGPDDAPTISRIDARSPQRYYAAIAQAVGHKVINRVMACLQQLGDQISHSGQDIARTERLQRICVARLVARRLSIDIVTHLGPFLYAVNRRQGAIPESGHTSPCTRVLLQPSTCVVFDSGNSLKYRDTMLDKRVKNRL